MARQPSLSFLLLCGLLPTAAIAAEERPKALEAIAGEIGEPGGRGAPEISTAELRSILEAKAAVVFDARSPREFATGHIPGAVNVAGKPGLPPSQYTSDIREVERVVHGDRSTPIIIYCNGMFCGRTKRLADDLLAAGFTDVRRYQLGMPVWRAFGGVQQIELEGLRSLLEGDKTAVLLDARGTPGLPRARGLALSDVKKAKDDGRLPMDDHHTRIIVIGGNAEQARNVAEGVAHDAFDNVAFFGGDAAVLLGIGGRSTAGVSSTAALVHGVKGTKVSLEQGLLASKKRGEPISAKFEVAAGKLQLSVYTATAEGFSEVIVDHATGQIACAAPITEGEDLTAAKAQAEAMAKARTSLQAAVTKVVASNKGYRAVSVTSSLENGHPVADVRLMRGEDARVISVALD